MVPGTVQQLTVLLVLVLPGVFYQAVREHLRGAVASEQEPQNRLVRAIAAGALLDAVYAVVAGPWLVRVLTGEGAGPVAGVLRQPREAGLAALVLVVLVPAGVAWAEAAWGRRRRRARYEPTPTAWDALFRERGSCFVRVRLKNGLWVGGWLGTRSAVSAYPQQGDVYLQAQYRMGPDGTFLGRVPGTAGVYVRAADVDVLELLHPPDPVPAPVPAPSAEAVNTREEGAEGGAARRTAL
ncbi:DUF6338 family protein [Streptomyces sp. NPDC053755]|uniref:DUF6338 family protein n=1 Tax=Streptomyces sp. NPDC053755 TaxID=3155815 RepID=UPI00341FC9F8